jgi:hypothetical protein
VAGRGHPARWPGISAGRGLCVKTLCDPWVPLGAAAEPQVSKGGSPSHVAHTCCDKEKGRVSAGRWRMRVLQWGQLQLSSPRGEVTDDDATNAEVSHNRLPVRAERAKCGWSGFVRLGKPCIVVYSERWPGCPRPAVSNAGRRACFAHMGALGCTGCSDARLLAVENRLTWWYLQTQAIDVAACITSVRQTGQRARRPVATL